MRKITGYILAQRIFDTPHDFAHIRFRQALIPGETEKERLWIEMWGTVIRIRQFKLGDGSSDRQKPRSLGVEFPNDLSFVATQAMRRLLHYRQHLGAESNASTIEKYNWK